MEHLRGQRRSGLAVSTSLDALLGVVLAAVVVAALYFAREVLIPIALAVLLAFVLAPLVQMLRRLRMPRIPAVLVSATLSLAAVLGLGGVIGVQLASLADELPQYAGTVQDKVQLVSQITTGRLTAAAQRVGPALAKVATPEERRVSRRSSTSRPLPVEVHQPPPSGFELARRLVGPVLAPLGTTAIVFVVAVFILLQQSDLRDRLIRLAGAGDVHRATQAIDDAAARLSRYFLSQLMVNAAFGVAVGVGLYFIGLPHTVVWAALAALMRFVPFFGGLISAALPIMLAAAVDPGWSMAVSTLVLFVVTETFTGQVVEPFLYGHSTGLSPVSIVVAAIFWSWLWGPIGLLLSTPLSMCLLVLGRHAPRLAAIEVILGDRPALSPSQSLYQRLLAGDAEEAVEQAELLLQGKPLSAYYDEVALPALRAAAADARHGRLQGERLRKVRDTLVEITSLLELHPDTSQPEAQNRDAAAALPAERDLSDGTPGSLTRAGDAPLVVCLAAHGALDFAASVMLSQLLQKHGFRARSERAEVVSRSSPTHTDWREVAGVCVVSCAREPSSARLSYVLTALRQDAKALPLVLLRWESQSESDGPADDANASATSLREAVDAFVSLLSAEGAASDAQNG